MNPQPNAFLSYVRTDDSDGNLSNIRDLLSSEVLMQWGRKFDIFQDTKDIRTGQEFEGLIKLNLDQVSFLIAILTPSYFVSKSCRQELEYFLTREKQLGRTDLVFPIYYIDCELSDKTMQAEDPLLKAISQRQFFDWRSLRTKQLNTQEVRESLSNLGRDITKAIKTSKVTIQLTQSDEDVDELVGEIRSVLREIQSRVEGSTFRRRFRAEVIRRVLVATREEIQKLSGPQDEYEQNLSLQENFIVRAGAIFEEASNICAISIDELSVFWIAEDQRIRAQEYTSRQPENTKRLFVFSSIENALKYRNVMAAHDEQYGRKGGVFFSTMRKYREFLTRSAKPYEVEELAKKDFAILVYKDRKGVDYYEATLSRTTLVCRKLQSPQSYQEVILSYFDELATTLSPGEINADGFTKWDPNFKTNNELWVQTLRRTFDVDTADEQSLINGGVYHLVFLSKDVPQQEVRTAVNDILRPKLVSLINPATSEKLLEEFWFGTRGEPVDNLKVIDGIYKGQIKTQNIFAENYPHCFVMKFRTMDLLEQYYQHEVHSQVRKVLYSLCDEHIASLYEMIEKVPSRDKEQRQALFHAIEGSASRLLVRADYVQQDALLSIVQLDAVPFDLPQRRDRGHLNARI